MCITLLNSKLLDVKNDFQPSVICSIFFLVTKVTLKLRLYEKCPGLSFIKKTTMKKKQMIFLKKKRSKISKIKNAMSKFLYGF